MPEDDPDHLEPPIADLTRKIMRSVGSRNTSPELTVRKALHAAGFRFRLHNRKLPGTPDIVLPRWRIAIFVQGCFWHRHKGCRYASVPKTRTAFWMAKFARNMERDRANRQALGDLGWRSIEVWECDIKKSRFLDTLLADIRSVSDV